MFEVPVAGSTEDIPDVVLKYDVEDIIFAIPAASAKRNEINTIIQT
jgi:FlaA1/EpsC-like NDP-sugar epimerase